MKLGSLFTAIYGALGLVMATAQTSLGQESLACKDTIPPRLYQDPTLSGYQVADLVQGDTLYESSLFTDGIISGLTTKRLYLRGVKNEITRLFAKASVCLVLKGLDGKPIPFPENRVEQSDGEVASSEGGASSLKSVPIAFASMEVTQQATPKQDTTKRKPATKPDMTAKAPPKAPAQSDPKILVLPANQVDTAAARRDQAHKDSVAFLEKLRQDSVTNAALTKFAADANEKKVIALNAGTAKDKKIDSLERALRNVVRDTSTGKRSVSSARLPIGKEQPSTKFAKPVTVVVPGATVYDTATKVFHDSVTNRIIFHDSTTHIVHDVQPLYQAPTPTPQPIIIQSGHNPWPWLFGIAVVGGVTTYFVCRNNNDCRPPSSHSSVSSIVNVNANVYPVSSKSRWLAVGGSVHF